SLEGLPAVAAELGPEVVLVAVVERIGVEAGRARPVGLPRLPVDHPPRRRRAEPRAPGFADRLRACQEQRSAGRIGHIVVPAGTVVDAVPPAARRPALEREELRRELRVVEQLAPGAV